ncbi:MAG: DUF3592 domain-containing protein [Vicingaceae bacterium]|nr:DUF3592 domain-containing protein [Vicingaceae bacterium]
MLKKKTVKIIGGFIIIIGLIILSLAIKDSTNIINLKYKGKIAKGIIYEEKFAKHETDEIFYYKIKYFINGNEYKIETYNNSSERRYTPGTNCEVYYEVNNPNNAVLNSWQETSGTIIISSTLSLIFMFIGLIFLLFPTSTSKVFNQK